MRSPRAVLVSIALLAAAPTAASASTVGIDGAGNTVFRSGAASADASTVGSYLFRDAADLLTAGHGCTATADGVQCEPTRIQSFVLGAGNDRLLAHSRAVSEVWAEGDAGNDDIDVDAVAGTTAHGGPGDDTVRVNAGGGTIAGGDSGNDDLYGQGTFARMSGGGGRDLIVGVAGALRPNELAGDAGDDQVILAFGKSIADGGSGADTIVALDNSGVSGTLLTGGGGRDTISAPTRPATIDGGAGRDVIDSHGRPLDGGEDPDRISCGVGLDTVYADAGDVVAADCERVRYGAAPALPEVAAALAHYDEAFG